MALPQQVLDQVKRTVAQAQQQIPELEKDIQQARLAGLDTTDLDSRLYQLKTTVTKLKQQYGV